MKKHKYISGGEGLVIRDIAGDIKIIIERRKTRRTLDKEKIIAEYKLRG